VRIGTLAARSGVPVRMLRYYEEKGLLAPRRAANGYREYEERDVTRAVLVTSMIRSGLPTRLIVPLLRQQCDAPDVAEADGPDRGIEALLRVEAARLDGRIACMSLSRRTIQEYLDRLNPGTPPSAASRS
jgi:DNA-binding transcriptional MerR regulator